MKTRVLYFSNKKKMKLFADILCAKLEAKSDTIPPAYPCENEKLVAVCVSLGKEVPDALRRFIREFSKQRAHNVAFVIEQYYETDEMKLWFLRQNGDKMTDPDVIEYSRLR